MDAQKRDTDIDGDHVIEADLLDVSQNLSTDEVESEETDAQEVAQLKDQLLRAMADTENLRKRSMKEKEEAQKFAIISFARDVLSIADNLARALSSLSSLSDEKKENNVALTTLENGIVMTQNEITAVLERHGVKKVPASGEKFDPHLHQAVTEIPDGSATPGTIVQVMQEGYQLHDRLLRPAFVAVAKAPPSSCFAPDTEQSEG